MNSKAITGSTNYQDASADRKVDNIYRLCYAGKTETLDIYTIKAEQASAGLPYLSIPLQNTLDIHPTLTYAANDVNIGDLDGDGEYVKWYWKPGISRTES